LFFLLIFILYIALVKALTTVLELARN